MKENSEARSGAGILVLTASEGLPEVSLFFVKVLL